MPEQAQILDYLGRSGDASFRWNWPCLEFDGGWFNWFINESGDGKEFVIGQAYGDHKAIAEKARTMARACHCDRIIFATKRNGKALARLTGAEVIATVLKLPMEG